MWWNNNQYEITLILDLKEHYDEPLKQGSTSKDTCVQCACVHGALLWTTGVKHWFSSVSVSWAAGPHARCVWCGVVRRSPSASRQRMCTIWSRSQQNPRMKSRLRRSCTWALSPTSRSRPQVRHTSTLQPTKPTHMSSYIFLALSISQERPIVIHPCLYVHHTWVALLHFCKVILKQQFFSYVIFFLSFFFFLAVCL